MIESKDKQEQFILFSIKDMLETNGGIVKIRFKDKEKEKWFLDTMKYKPRLYVLAKEDDVTFEAFES